MNSRKIALIPAYEPDRRVIDIAAELKNRVLDIYGTTNRLIAVYPIIAAVLLIATITVALRK